MQIERAFVISLSFREERLEAFRKQTEGIKSIPEIELWPAVHGDTCKAPDIWTAGYGAWGCYRSHLNILEYCLNHNINSYIVFEDDSQFRPAFDEKFKAFFDEVPSDWDQVYLGGQLQHSSSHPPIRLTDKVFRPFNVNRTHCFAVSRKGMLPMYRHIANLPFMHEEHIDHHLGRWHEDPRVGVYCPDRWLVGQMGYDSDIKGEFLDINFFDDPITLELRHWLYSKPACVYYHGPSSLLRSARKLLHPGNQLDSHGYDLTLAHAALFAEPKPEIARWFHWIRSEIVRGGSSAIPCFNHPRFTPEFVAETLGVPVYTMTPKTLDEIAAQVDKIRKDHSNANIHA
jgi:GR25 family glycosyltransferase involved in LPS biosynthesis